MTQQKPGIKRLCKSPVGIVPETKLAEIDGILKDMADKTDRDYNAKIHSGDQILWLKIMSRQSRITRMH